MSRAIGARGKIERTAVELFAAKGVDGVSIAEIAAGASVSQGALYRHYRSKEELAWSLFSTAYLQTGAQLDAIAAEHAGLPAQIGGMVNHFCELYDRDPALFRFMLLAQHDLLPRIPADQRTPVDAIADVVTAAGRSDEISRIDPSVAAAVIIGIVLQTAIFHIYGRLSGSLAARAPALARAAVAAIAALGEDSP